MAYPASTGIAARIAVVNGQATTTTQDIADVYGKRHDRVMAIVRQRMAEAGEWGVHNFVETPHTNPQNGQTYTVIRMTKKGFHFVVGKFTGAKAVQHQIGFADGFEAMEAALAGRAMVGHAPETAPAINVRELLLSGQSQPVPLPPEVSAAIDAQAWAMAGEVHALAREHLRRRVAYRFVTGSALHVNTPAALAHIKTVGVGEALAHTYWSELRSVQQVAASMSRMVQAGLANIDAALDRAHAPQPQQPQHPGHGLATTAQAPSLFA